jgi:preprotein translocase subunit SecF
MKLLRLVPDNTKIRFMRFRTFSFPAALIIAAISLFLFSYVGLNYGIDFKGGTIIEMKTQGPADVGAIRAQLGALDVGAVQVQQFGQPDEVLVRIEQQDGGEQSQQAAVNQIRQLFEQTAEIRRVEIVGPSVSGELAAAASIAILVALVGIMIYVWIRFEWQFAVGAILTTVNDVLVTVGLFVILQLDFSLSSIAAVLTIIGYSLNDTVVVYDRIRENLRKYKKMALPDLLDLSINETLTRTTMTSVTTLLALVALYAFGGEVIQSFTLAMIFGILIGTYSSIFLAAPFLILFGLRQGGSDKDGEKAARTDAAPAA